jgi:hypothetical protein
MNYSDWLYDQEDEELFSGLHPLPPQWAEFGRPAEVKIDWHKNENQGRMGSCQGNDLTSCLERLAMVRGESVQLSRIFAYLATQKIDSLLGSDRGSTISGGVKLALSTGVPPEKLTGYPKQYPSRSSRNEILKQEHYDLGSPYKAMSSWRVSQSHDEVLNFIGGGGAITFGIRWYSSIIPRDRIVKKFSPGSSKGGHAMAVLGYDLDGNLIAVNSHGDGPYKIMQGAWLQMLNHRYTRAVGLLGTSQPDPVDWYKQSPYYD